MEYLFQKECISDVHWEREEAEFQRYNHFFKGILILDIAYFEMMRQ